MIVLYEPEKLTKLRKNITRTEKFKPFQVLYLKKNIILINQTEFIRKFNKKY